MKKFMNIELNRNDLWHLILKIMLFIQKQIIEDEYLNFTEMQLHFSSKIRYFWQLYIWQILILKQKLKRMRVMITLLKWLVKHILLNHQRRSWQEKNYNRES
ncbi:unnamed protein product [Paramecium sonneborni]|uniref:Uncharacterized protein n=1 Tax=Paramecium sonneborni TaxID=65129 RepID=A0A8S1RTI6_9CILI|nr:unnamed protein product [Paramecium sonneborni]